jgi:hypothetical protein
MPAVVVAELILITALLLVDLVVPVVVAPEVRRQLELPERSTLVVVVVAPEPMVPPEQVKKVVVQVAPVS